MLDLGNYMTENIRGIMAEAYRNMLGTPREGRFVLKMQQSFRRSERKRKKMLEKEGLEVPPFLIASIATQCNLHCKGCYARKNGIAADKGEKEKKSLQPEQWRTIFNEAADMGINFALLAGGEPLTRRDLLEEIAKVKEIIFPIFTNGTLIGGMGPNGKSYMDFFRKNLNMIPVVSLEGDLAQTDNRRGAGVYRRVREAMAMLKEEHLFYGVSITVTTENVEQVTSEAYLRQLRDEGCKLVFFVEYVPLDAGTEHLALSEEQNKALLTLLDERRTSVKGMIVLSFPGDEQALDGCLAAGRGFFHIGPDGAAEPCPFSPYSDSNVVETGLKAALQSPLFHQIRGANALSWKHTGGCTLYEHREEVEAFLKEKKK